MRAQKRITKKGGERKAKGPGGAIALAEPPAKTLPDPAVASAKRAFDLMQSLALRSARRTLIRQVDDTIWECQIFLLAAGRRHLLAKERGNTPGSAIEAALIVARAEGAEYAALHGLPLQLAQVRPDLPYVEDLDAWAATNGEATNGGPEADPDAPSAAQGAPARAGRGSRPARAPRTRPSAPSGATALYEFVVETITGRGQPLRIADMMAIAEAAGHPADNLRIRVALRDAATNGAIARLERGLYGALRQETIHAE